MKAKDPEFLTLCTQVLDAIGITAERDLAAEMMQLVARLAEDEPGRAEMLLLLRSLRELRYAFKIFKPFRHRRKVSMFGSARTPPEHPDYRLAESFARLAASAGFMVITGAGPGIMHAGNVGAAQAHSFGLAIRLPFEAAANPVILGSDKLINFRYFFSRKLVFVKETHAIALFPGGFGTHDEAFEVLTLVQTGRCDPLPIVMVEHPGGTYWAAWDRFVREQLLAGGMISADDRSLYFITQEPQEAVRHIARFYCNYQSLRYVKDTLVLRVRHAPTAEELEALNRDFATIIRAGAITLGTTAAVEPDSKLPDMPCLLLQFDRRAMARLRQLIDRLNTLPSLPPIDVTASAAAEVGADESDRGVAEIAEEEPIQIANPGA